MLRLVSDENFPDRMPIGQAIDEILFLCIDVAPDEWKDQVLFLPL